MNESTARNIRVQDRYDELMRIGRHGHYETMFQVVREEIESLRQQLAEAQVFEALWTGACEVAKNDPVQAIYRLRERVALLQEAIDALEDFADTVAPFSSFWEEVWPKYQEALAATEH